MSSSRTAMDKRQHPPVQKPQAPSTEAPVRRHGYTGRGAASALETLKKLEQAQPKLDEREPRHWI